MRVSRTTVTRHGGASPGARAGRRAIPDRRGLVLSIETSDGILAQGEASPLPGYSPDTLELAETELRAFDFASVPEATDVSSARSALRTATVSLRSNAARFAVETALLHVAGVRSKRPVWSMLSEPSGTVENEAPSRRLSVFVGSTSDEGVVEAARAAVRKGIRSIKVKIGSETRRELPVLEAVRDAIGEAGLRLDANQGLNAETVATDLDLLATVNPEWIEEPLRLGALLSLARSPVPIALDESLQDEAAWPRLSPHLASLGCVALILKPMALGGVFECLQWAERARAAGLDVCLSHLFDGPLALAATAHLALSIGSAQRSHGVPQHAGLAAWPEVPLPFLGEAVLSAPREPGLGVPFVSEGT